MIRSQEMKAANVVMATDMIQIVEDKPLLISTPPSLPDAHYQRISRAPSEDFFSVFPCLAIPKFIRVNRRTISMGGIVSSDGLMASDLRSISRRADKATDDSMFIQSSRTRRQSLGCIFPERRCVNVRKAVAYESSTNAPVICGDDGMQAVASLGEMGEGAGSREVARDVIENFRR